MTHSPTARVLLEKNFVGRERQRFLKHSNSTSRLILPRNRQQTPTPVLLAHPSGVVASSSTSHFTQPINRTLAESGKRFASTEGRFTIIDERNKGPDSDESTSDESDDEPIMMAPARLVQQPTTPKCLSPPTSTSCEKKTPCKMPTSSSRFKIVPVESHYKRGRWDCYDYYDENSAKKAVTNVNAIRKCAALGSKNTSNKENIVRAACFVQKPPKPADPPAPLMSSTLAAPNRLNQQSTATVPVTAAQRPPVTFNFESDNESDRENNTPSSNFVTSASSSPPPPPPLSPRYQTASLNVTAVTTKKNSDASSEGGDSAAGIPPPPAATPTSTPLPARTQRPQQLLTTTNSELGSINSINGRISPSDLISNYGLERSLSVASYTDRSILDLLPGTVPPAGTPFAGHSDERLARHSETEASSATSENNGSSTNPSQPNSIVGIDLKIEQAMDLVKTHLMFAVREEVEVLKARIMELETTVIQLEAENSILREHVPADILTKMNMQPSV